jgi:hypothetical protein
VARIALFIVWLVCACQGCPHTRQALRAGFSVGGSTLTVLVEPGVLLVRISRRDLWPNAKYISAQQGEDSANMCCDWISRGLKERVMALCKLSDICRATQSKNPPGLFLSAELQPATCA